MKNYLFFFIIVTLLSGCGLPTKHELSLAEKEQYAPNELNFYINKEYDASSRRALTRYDYGNALHYAQKAKAGIFNPNVIANTIHGKDRVTLEAARKNLVEAYDAGVGDDNPQNLAKAVSFFDCWANEQAEQHDVAEITYCFINFQLMMSELRAPNVAITGAGLDSTSDIRPFYVYFGFDSTNIAYSIEQQITQHADIYHHFNIPNIYLHAYADTVGSSTYNKQLSVARANEVAAIIKTIHPTAIIHIVAHGEDNLPDPTADNVKSSGNRLVIISNE